MLALISRFACLVFITLVTCGNGMQPGFIRVELEPGKGFSQDHLINLDNSLKGPLTLCSLSCREEPLCETFTFSETDGSCFMYSKLLVEDNPTAPPMAYFEAPSLLLLRHDSRRGGLFPRTSAAGWGLNKDDPNAAHYSRLDELDQYKGYDGLYNFKVCYPDLSTEEKCFIFDQASDPRTNQPLSGVKVHSIPPEYSLTCYTGPITSFDGLVSDTSHHTWLDGIAESGRFYMALGQFHEIGGTAPAGRIAGPRCRTPNHWFMLHVELYIRLK